MGLCQTTSTRGWYIALGAMIVVAGGIAMHVFAVRGEDRREGKAVSGPVSDDAPDRRDARLHWIFAPTESSENWDETIRAKHRVIRGDLIGGVVWTWQEMRKGEGTWHTATYWMTEGWPEEGHVPKAVIEATQVLAAAKVINVYPMPAMRRHVVTAVTEQRSDAIREMLADAGWRVPLVPEDGPWRRAMERAMGNAELVMTWPQSSLLGKMEAIVFVPTEEDDTVLSWHLLDMSAVWMTTPGPLQQQE